MGSYSIDMLSVAVSYRNVYVFAGVPNIIPAMFDGIAAELIGGDPVITKTLSNHLRESEIAEGLETLQEEYPGSYPFYKNKRFGMNVVSRGTDEMEMEMEKLKLKLKDLI